MCLLFVAVDSSCRQAYLCSPRSRSAQLSVSVAPSALCPASLSPLSTTCKMSVSQSKKYERELRDDRQMNSSPRSDAGRSHRSDGAGSGRSHQSAGGGSSSRWSGRSSERVSGRHSDPGVRSTQRTYRQAPYNRRESSYLSWNRSQGRQEWKKFSQVIQEKEEGHSSQNVASGEWQGASWGSNQEWKSHGPSAYGPSVY